MSESDTCPICVESFNKTTHKPITCIRCEEKICESCIQRYLLDTPHTPHCMNCRTEWDRMFYGSHLSTTFTTKSLKTHREKMLFECQRAEFPNTMPLLEQQRIMIQIKEQQTVIANKIRQLNLQMNALENRYTRAGDQYRRIRNRLIRHQPGQDAANQDNNENNNNKGHYGRPCVTVDCPGFIHSSTGFCNSCNKTTCVACNTSKENEENAEHPHECQDGDIQMWNHLRQTTKPCPGCHTRIFKNGGCPQMWCSQCHTAFNWNTGNIERGPVHNPHYYQWLFREGGGNDQNAPRRQRVRNLFGNEDIGCHGDVHVSALALRRRVERLGNSDTIYKKWIVQQHQLFSHFQNVSLPSIREKQNPHTFEGQKVDLRLSYLSGNITETFYRIQLQRLEKRFLKHQELYRIYQTFSTIVEEVFRQFVRQTDLPIAEFYEQLVDICSITNEGIQNINQSYKSRISKLHLAPLR